MPKDNEPVRLPPLPYDRTINDDLIRHAQLGYAIDRLQHERTIGGHSTYYLISMKNEREYLAMRINAVIDMRLKDGRKKPWETV